MTEVPTWRWVVFIVFFILFPIVFHPWWLTILSMALFGTLAFLLKPGTPDSKYPTTSTSLK
jgi:hypothetical protein